MALKIGETALKKEADVFKPVSAYDAKPTGAAEPQAESLTKKRPVVLIICDGYGMSPYLEGNPMAVAKQPNFTRLWCQYKHTAISAAGEAAGLPWGDVGNSEVGHLNIGAGRVIYQMLPRIERAIADKTFFKNEAFLGAINHAKQNNSNLHLMGVFSPAAVHGTIKHLFNLLKLCSQESFTRVYIHCFTDGRDSPPKGSPVFFEKTIEEIRTNKVGTIATMVGRYFAMDRDNRWDRTQQAYDLLTQGIGEKFENWKTALDAKYAAGESDEFIKPTIFAPGGNVPPPISDNDAVIFWNFRPDRAKQITLCFMGDETFDSEKFKRNKILKNLFFVTMSDYEQHLPVHVAFPPIPVINTLPEVLAQNNLRQLHIAETEKYAHVTYFFNGEKEEKQPGEDRILIPSPKVATYDLKPEMSAPEITEAVIAEINKDKYDVIILNFANPDMVGHTGKFEATVKALETVDKCVGAIVTAVLAKDGVVLVTADHGNAEEMVNPATGQPDKEHSAYPVPLLVIGNDYKRENPAECPPMQGPLIPPPTGVLGDIAPTMLEILGIEKPKEMTGVSLLRTIE